MGTPEAGSKEVRWEVQAPKPKARGTGKIRLAGQRLFRTVTRRNFKKKKTRGCTHTWAKRENASENINLNKRKAEKLTVGQPGRRQTPS